MVVRKAVLGAGGGGGCITQNWEQGAVLVRGVSVKVNKVKHQGCYWYRIEWGLKPTWLPHEAGRLCAACWCAACSSQGTRGRQRGVRWRRRRAEDSAAKRCPFLLPTREGRSPLSAGPSRGYAICRPCLPTLAASPRSARGGPQTLHKWVQGSGGSAAAGCTARRRWFTEFGVVFTTA